MPAPPRSVLASKGRELLFLSRIEYYSSLHTPTYLRAKEEEQQEE
jgi:hypothetical protein